MEPPERTASPKINIKNNKENGLEFQVEEKLDILNKAFIEIHMEKLAGVFSKLLQARWLQVSLDNLHNYLGRHNY